MYFSFMNMYVCNLLWSSHGYRLKALRDSSCQLKDTHWGFNGGYCSVGLVSQRSTRGGGGGGLWLHLAEREGDVIHQKQVTATVKCWKDIQSRPLLWGRTGVQETATTFSQNRLKTLSYQKFVLETIDNTNCSSSRRVKRDLLVIM